MTFIYILAAIFIFGVLIALHEFGHFAAAKLCGVRVNEFSIGMGPKIWGFKKGKTTCTRGRLASTWTRLRVLPKASLWRARTA